MGFRAARAKAAVAYIFDKLRVTQIKQNCQAILKTFTHTIICVFLALIYEYFLI